MGNNITQKLKYKESVVKFSYKYGVTKAAIKFSECRRTIYRWRERYDGSLESLKDKSRRPHYHPNQHTKEEIKSKKIITDVIGAETPLSRSSLLNTCEIDFKGYKKDSLLLKFESLGLKRELYLLQLR